MDGSEAARAAFVFVTDWARQFDAQVWFIQLTRETTRRRCSVATDVRTRGRTLTNGFSVSGATKATRDQQLVEAITDAAATFAADLIVVGFDRQRLGNQRFSRGLRERLTVSTHLPVLVAPQEARPRRVAPASRPAIALGPALAEVPAHDAELLVGV
jgi:K+-sensing histidine kinase KdpD